MVNPICMMQLAPIVVFAYDRPDHLSRTLDALSKNDLAKDSVLYVYCDGIRPLSSKTKNDAPNYQHRTEFYGTKEQYEDYVKRIETTRQVARQQTGFKELRIVEREKNIGLADNIVGAVTEIVNKFGRVIAFEDDVVSTRGCLTYLNDALEMYQNDEKVMHISAYLFPHRQHLPTTFFHPNPYPAGGWATWARAWKHYCGNTKELVDFWSNDWDTFNVIGQDHLQKQLIMNLDGRLKTWYIKWYASMRRQGGVCLYPGWSMTNNIGFDNSGETSGISNSYFIENPQEYTKVNRISIHCNKKAFRMLKVRASGHWYSKRYRREWEKQLLKIMNKLKEKCFCKR